MKTLLSERSQSQNSTRFMVPLYEMSRIGKFIETESRLVVVWGCGEGRKGWEVIAKGHRVAQLCEYARSH